MCSKLVTLKHLEFFPLLKVFLLSSFRSLIAQCTHPTALILKIVIYGILMLLVILLALSLFYGGKAGDYDTPSFTYLIQTHF